MGVNNVTFGAVTIIDISDSTVRPEVLGKGETAYDKTGEKIIGTKEDAALQEKTVSPSTSAQVVTPDSGYDGLSKVNINAVPIAEQATPEINVSKETGLITASATQSAGYVADGVKSANYMLSTVPGKTIIPSTEDQTIPWGNYLTGTQIIKGDPNLLPENIVKGVRLFGVTGSAEGSGGASVETCTITVDATSTPFNEGTVYYIDSTFNRAQIDYFGFETVSFTTVLGTFFYVKRNGDSFSGNDTVLEVVDTSGVHIFFAGGNGTIST